MSKRILAICEEVVAEGSYKRATAAAGQLKVLAETASKSDNYWREMVQRGEIKEQFFLDNQNAIAPIIGPDGNLSPEHWIAEKKARLGG